MKKVLLITHCLSIITFLTGCTYTRNAPLISNASINPIKIDSKLIIKDSANGNTVPVSAVP